MRKYHHLGRPVDVVSYDSLNERAPASSAEAVWMFWINEDADFQHFVRILKVILVARPLLVMVSGEMRAEAFTQVLDHLAVMPVEPHVMTMTGEGDLRASIEDFLYAGWPAEERFDEWQKHFLVVPDEAVANVDAVLRSICDEIDGKAKGTLPCGA